MTTLRDAIPVLVSAVRPCAAPILQLPSLFQYSLRVRNRRSLRKTVRRAEKALRYRIDQMGASDLELRARLKRIGRQIQSAQRTNESACSLELERASLQMQIANRTICAALSASKSDEYRSAAAARDALRDCEEQVASIRSSLHAARRRIGIGYLFWLVVLGAIATWQYREHLPAVAGSHVPTKPRTTPPAYIESAQEIAVDFISFRRIPAGEFDFGSQAVEPGHDPSLETLRHVAITNDFFLSQYEVTQSQYWRIVDSGRELEDELRNKPIIEVSFAEAEEFCERLSHSCGYRCRLPTEVEWEYACRAREVRMYSIWRGSPDPHANLDEAVTAWTLGDTDRLDRRARSLFNFDRSGPENVGMSGPSNAFGLFDVHGNVWEWCAQDSTTADDEPSLRHRPIRGGAWSSTTCLDCRSAKRAWQPQDSRQASIGFRVLLEIPLKDRT